MGTISRVSQGKTPDTENNCAQSDLQRTLNVWVLVIIIIHSHTHDYLGRLDHEHLRPRAGV